ncbi:DUF4292 domain-containing protein [Rhodohalobacter sp. 8-1]|uniref:DUF4292 domain-containing protein n=1 Tax=Rhodohalobacter sp. 8-1 TaxID=3131972 RepID=UPI0030EEE31E
MNRIPLTCLTLLLVFVFIAYGCAGPRAALEYENLDLAMITADSLVAMMPDYSEELQTMTGTGRALVSEPGGSERVTVEFQSNRTRSLLTIRTGIGIEGGQILIEPDSVLIYNKVDGIAQKVSPAQSTLSSVGSIASLNMLDLFNFVIDVEQVEQIFDNGDTYLALLSDRAAVEVGKSSGRVVRVDRSQSPPPIPYQLIEYDGYANIDRFQLPRKITIFSADGNSRATFLVQQLSVNGKLPPLKIELPDDVPIYRP